MEASEKPQNQQKSNKYLLLGWEPFYFCVPKSIGRENPIPYTSDSLPCFEWPSHRGHLRPLENIDIYIMILNNIKIKIMK